MKKLLFTLSLQISDNSNPSDIVDQIEGINNKIGALQRRAYGYRNYEHLKQRLLALHHTVFTLNG